MSSEHKRRFIEALFEQNTLVRVYINPQARGLRVPEWLYKAPFFFELGLNLPIPIPDLQLTEDGFTATLSFQRLPYKCVVPWTAVFAIAPASDEAHGLVWAEDLPAVQGVSANSESPAKPVPLKQQVPKLALAEVVDLASFRQKQQALA